MNTEFVPVKRDDLNNWFDVVCGSYNPMDGAVRGVLAGIRAALEQPGVGACGAVHKAVCAAVEQCKNASGTHVQIDLMVNAVQIAHDVLGTDTAPKPVQQPSMEICGHQFQDREGKWCNFINEEHYRNTVADGSWPIREIYAAAPQPAQQKGPAE